jgi:putative DNA primase/helicase
MKPLDANAVAREQGPDALREKIDAPIECHEPKIVGLNPTNGAKGELATVCVADVQPRPIEWLWPGRIARGKLTLLAGLPNMGKSQIVIDISARLSAGFEWPDGGRAPVCGTLMFSAEDSVEDTIRPRYEAAGAELRDLHVVKMVIDDKGARRSFNLQDDINRLWAKIDAVGNVGLVIIDPITSYMGSTVDSHRTADVRRVLEPFSALADYTGVAVLAITHPPKSAQSNALHAFTGSLAFVASARIALLAVEEPGTERRLLLPVKNNIGPRAKGLGYRLEQTIISLGIVTSRVAWDGAPVTVTADEAMQAASDEKSMALADAEEFLREELSGGPREAAEVKERAAETPGRFRDCSAAAARFHPTPKVRCGACPASVLFEPSTHFALL